MNCKSLVMLCCLLPLASGVESAAAEPPPLKPIAELELPRYVGRWYELAKLPNFFQNQCVSDTTAEYVLNDRGGVDVTNRCRREDGEFAQAKGEARRVGDGPEPTFEVRFAPAWLSFIPLVWGDYWVIDLDTDYQLAAVSEPRRKYLWILSRTPRVDPARYEALRQRLLDKDFDLSELELTTHGEPEPIASTQAPASP